MKYGRFRYDTVKVENRFYRQCMIAMSLESDCFCLGHLTNAKNFLKALTRR